MKYLQILALGKEMKITKFEFVSHGMESSDCFQGCGVAFTEYDDVATGRGNSPQQAANDALDQICQSHDWASDEVLDEAEAEAKNFLDEAQLPEDLRIPETADDVYYFVSIRVSA